MTFGFVLCRFQNGREVFYYSLQSAGTNGKFCKLNQGENMYSVLTFTVYNEHFGIFSSSLLSYLCIVVPTHQTNFS